MIQDTSRQSFKEIKNEKDELGKRSNQVYQTLVDLGEANNTMIKKELEQKGINLPISSITSRINELRNQLKMVGFVKKDICPYTKKLTMFWKRVK